jgi:hypothetical protein
MMNVISDKLLFESDYVPVTLHIVAYVFLELSLSLSCCES